MPKDELERKYNILVYGIEKRALSAVPSEPLRRSNYTLTFDGYETSRRFQEFDGVVLFQGLFERFERKSNYMNAWLEHSCDRDELDKRKKETHLLAQDGGFICFLLNEPFVDRDDGRDFSSTDLAKARLNYRDLHRENISQRAAHVQPSLDEFKRFLDVFGAASSYFRIYNKTLDYRVLAKIGDTPVGLVIGDSDFFVPTLVPDNRAEVIIEYFDLLADALTSVHNRLHQSVPTWVAAYRFEVESSLEGQAAELRGALAKITARQAEVNSYKSILSQSGDKLVSVVATIMQQALGVTVDQTDDFREDLKLLDNDKQTIAICEVKGINRGISRENINQADSHRERSGFDSGFPAILVANTAIKSARNLAEKDQSIALEQVKHAVKMGILLIRSLDLLGLLRLVMAGKLTTEAARMLVLNEVGWLQVNGEEIRIWSGESSVTVTPDIKQNG
ncbi:MAG TPA: hypothetical protein VFX20_19905 [Steroidobacteraceae bacterium]|nr:hypothetical protein [Steroidobacteraceae bacterium]